MLKKKLKVILINLLEEGLVEKVSAPWDSKCFN